MMTRRRKLSNLLFSDDFLANCESYNRKAPSAVSIIALEDAVIIKINIKKLQPPIRLAHESVARQYSIVSGDFGTAIRTPVHFIIGEPVAALSLSFRNAVL